MKNLVFLKLGGSLITDKDQESTALPDRLHDIGRQINRAIKDHPDQKLLIGHGSGSFGHHAAKKYGTRDGYTTGQNPETYWSGFQVVYQQAHQLNHLVMQALWKTGNPCIAFPPSAAVKTENHSIQRWGFEPIEAALKANQIPVIFGDVIFDDAIGGTILSTEDLFCHLAGFLHPEKILLAGIEKGVWQDFPTRTTLLKRLDRASYPAFQNSIHGSGSVDVTGGMHGKVRQMLDLAGSLESLSIRIFSGVEEDAILKALSGQETGTLIES